MQHREKPIITIAIFLFMLAAGLTVFVTSYLSQRRSQAPTQTSAAQCAMRFVVGPATTATPFPTATPVTSPSPTPGDNVFFKIQDPMTPQANKFFVFPEEMPEPIHLTPTVISQAKDPTKLISGKRYKIRVDLSLQNVVKTSEIDSRYIRTALTVNGTEIDEAEWPLSLVSNSSGGGGALMGGVFTARQGSNMFELRTDTRNTIIETNENDNVVTATYQVSLPAITLRIRPDSITGTPASIQARVNVGKTNDLQPYFSQVVTFQRNGSDFLATLPVETYEEGSLWVAIKGEKHVQKLFGNQEFSATKTIDLTGQLLAPGDTPPQDGVVNINDVNLLLSIISKQTKTPQEIFSGDLNYDTVVNAADVSVILKTLSSKADEVPF